MSTPTKQIKLPEVSVFINCPFDEEYLPILQAIIYTVYRCGFSPRSALEEDNALQNRLGKIEQLIEDCKYGIHDISRIESNKAGLPRFNMPFELGMFFGAKRFGNTRQKNKNALVFERDRFSYQQYISDLNGIDTHAHNNQPDAVVRIIRDWLSNASRRKTIPGHRIILDDYHLFLGKLPDIAGQLGFDRDRIPFNDYCVIVENAIAETLK